VPSERGSIKEQSIKYCGWACCVYWRVAWRSQFATHHVTKQKTPIHIILSTGPQLSISQKALGTLPEDVNEMPKHAGATIHNQ
jgi:hypothetical protein